MEACPANTIHMYESIKGWKRGSRDLISEDKVST